MARIREIKKRIGAVGNIQRITKTMQMIATAKFTAAVERTNATRPFTDKIRQLTAELASAVGDAEHPLIAGSGRKSGRELMLIIASDRGLCGAYNANVLRMATKYYRNLEKAGKTPTVEIAGKKAVAYCAFHKFNVAHRHEIGDKPAYEDVEAVASRYMEQFIEGEFDAVHVAYMRYESNARQIPEVIQLLPLSPPEVDDAESGGETGGGGEAEAKGAYEFSPSAEALLDELLPLAVKTSLFQAFNDAVVSEQIMRMVAMKAATENAKDLGRSLKRQFNRARQAMITTELMEVIAGSTALE